MAFFKSLIHQPNAFPFLNEVVVIPKNPANPLKTLDRPAHTTYVPFLLFYYLLCLDTNDVI